MESRKNPQEFTKNVEKSKKDPKEQKFVNNDLKDTTGKTSKHDEISKKYISEGINPFTAGGLASLGQLTVGTLKVRATSEVKEVFVEIFNISEENDIALGDENKDKDTLKEKLHGIRDGFELTLENLESWKKELHPKITKCLKQANKFKQQEDVNLKEECEARGISFDLYNQITEQLDLDRQIINNAIENADALVNLYKIPRLQKRHSQSSLGFGKI